MAPEIEKRRKKDKFRQDLIFYILLSITAAFMAVPFIWMISTSLKHPDAVFIYPPKWIPDYNYIIENGKKVTVNVIGEKYEIEYLEGRLKGQRGETFKKIMEVDSKHWWQPWKKKYSVNTSEEKNFYQWDEIKLLKGEAVVEIVKEVDEVYAVEKRTLPIKDVYTGIKPVWSNYRTVIEKIPFARFYWNSIIVAFCVTIGQVFTSAMAGYAFSRLSFPGRDKLFFGYLATMMIPQAVILVPVFILMTWLNWIDSYKALIVPAMFSAYGTFMLRQFFMTIPVDLEDAAKIDGCNYIRIFWSIILPLSKPALATLTVFTFMGSWMNFMWPLIVTNRVEMKTLPVGLAYFQETGFGTQYELLMAGAFMAVIPLVLIFIFTQRFFVEGIKMQGIKG
ncbi:MAG: carbohydrate ABC transporter permease [Candidatus Omnitrophica bacterium]|nr:carbohydrate ABC transporter permease [Candidatus Omnitrophota bacterium]